MLRLDFLFSYDEADLCVMRDSFPQSLCNFKTQWRPILVTEKPSFMSKETKKLTLTRPFDEMNMESLIKYH